MRATRSTARWATAGRGPRRARRRRRPRVGVLTGAGKASRRAWTSRRSSRANAPARDRGFAGIVERRARKPLIAAIEGFAVAGGLEIALACDLVVASRRRALGIPEAKRGLVAAGGALLRLPRRIPLHVRWRWRSPASRSPPSAAHELGLVNRLTEPGRVRSSARWSWPSEIAANAPLASPPPSRSSTRQGDWSDEEFWAKQAEIVGPGLRLGGRARGCDRVLREARAGLEGPLSRGRPRPQGRPAGRTAPATRARRTPRAGAAPSGGPAAAAGPGRSARRRGELPADATSSRALARVKKRRWVRSNRPKSAYGNRPRAARGARSSGRCSAAE